MHLIINFYVFVLYKNKCSYITFSIVIRNGRIVWKHGPHCWYFHLNLKYLGWPYRTYIKTVLATFCCYDHGATASEEVQKITTDQKEYRKCSSSVIICWIAKIYLSINNSGKRLSCTEKRAVNGPWWVLSIMQVR